MGREYEIIPYDSKFRSETLELLTPLWGANLEANSRYFDWKYQQNPYSRKPLMYLALDGGNVVGTDSYFVSCWETGKGRKRYHCVHGCDAVVHPAHRGRGLHKRIKAVAMDYLKTSEYELEITMASNEITESHNIKAGGLSVAELKRLRWKMSENGGRLRSLGRLVPGAGLIYRCFRGKADDGKRGSMSSAKARPFSILDANFVRYGTFGHSKISLAAEPRPESMALLVSRMNRGGQIKHVRDKEFYSWRYRNPSSVYRFLYLEKGGGDLQGFVVVQLPASGTFTAGFIVDWEASTREVFSELLGALIRYGGFSLLEIWAITLRTEEANSLKKLGFSAKETADARVFYPHLLVLPLRDPGCCRLEKQDFVDIHNWDLRPIYSDSY